MPKINLLAQLANGINKESNGTKREILNKKSNNLNLTLARMEV